MSHEPSLYLALLLERGLRTITISRGRYIGLPVIPYLPGMELSQQIKIAFNEKTLAIRDLGTEEALSQEKDMWNEEPATLSLVRFTGFDIEPIGNGALWDNLHFRDPRFDMTIDMVRRFKAGASQMFGEVIDFKRRCA